MKKTVSKCIIGLVLGMVLGVSPVRSEAPPTKGVEMVNSEKEKVVKSAEEWRETLSPEEFYILRKKGTEWAFTGKYHDHKGDGVYTCAGYGLPLFDSKTKFDSGTGWPSYWDPVHEKNVATAEDNSLFMKRVEVLCARCGGHLGHVFEDGPKPTGLRYCINSAALDFKNRSEK